VADKRGRKPNEANTESFYVTVHKNLYDYLVYLARHSHTGANVGDVAADMLVRQAEHMYETKFHEKKLPKP
jgi:hypothetical protein